MIVCSLSTVFWFITGIAMISKILYYLSGALLMENVNRPWAWLLNAGDWIS
jgi:hypothetical protein